MDTPQSTAPLGSPDFSKVCDLHAKLADLCAGHSVATGMLACMLTANALARHAKLDHSVMVKLAQRMESLGDPTP